MASTLCQRCSKYPATIHYTEIQGTKRREFHFCEACAQEQGLEPNTPIPPLLADLMQGELRQGARTAVRCPHCGITFDEFRNKGRFGCPRDYEVFEQALDPLLDKIHGSHQHTGRLPRGRRTVETETSDRLLRLRRELQEAVRAENYEDAARLRDEIRDLDRAGADRTTSTSTRGDE